MYGFKKPNHYGHAWFEWFDASNELAYVSFKHENPSVRGYIVDNRFYIL